MDYSSLPTPEACYADFCLIPVGTGSVSVAAEVAAVQKLLEASGLVYTMHSAGTTVGAGAPSPLPSLPVSANGRLTREAPQRARGTL